MGVLKIVGYLFYFIFFICALNIGTMDNVEGNCVITDKYTDNRDYEVLCKEGKEYKQILPEKIYYIKVKREEYTSEISVNKEAWERLEKGQELFCTYDKGILFGNFWFTEVYEERK